MFAKVFTEQETWNPLNKPSFKNIAMLSSTLCGSLCIFRQRWKKQFNIVVYLIFLTRFQTNNTPQAPFLLNFTNFAAEVDSGTAANP